MGSLCPLWQGYNYCSINHEQFTPKLHIITIKFKIEWHEHEFNSLPHIPMHAFKDLAPKQFALLARQGRIPNPPIHNNLNPNLSNDLPSYNTLFHSYFSSMDNGPDCKIMFFQNKDNPCNMISPSIMNSENGWHIHPSIMPITKTFVSIR